MGLGRRGARLVMSLSRPWSRMFQRRLPSLPISPRIESQAGDRLRWAPAAWGLSLARRGRVASDLGVAASPSMGMPFSRYWRMRPAALMMDSSTKREPLRRPDW